MKKSIAIVSTFLLTFAAHSFAQNKAPEKPPTPPAAPPTAPALEPAPAAPMKVAGEIQVNVAGFHNAKGQLGCVIFKTDNGFPMKSELGVQRMVVPFNKDTGGTCVFKDIPAGKYSIAVMHDENMNRKCDTKVFGIPTEGWAVSNNAPARTFGPPKFESALFSYNGGALSMTLKLRY